MNKKLLLFIGSLLSISLLTAAESNCTGGSLIADFENNATLDVWGGTQEIVDNPSANGANKSAKCLKVTFSENWGAVAKSTNVNYYNYGCTFLVYMGTPGDVSMRAINSRGEELEMSQSVFVANEWARVWFDFSDKTLNSNTIQIFTGSKNTIYIDSIQIVCLEDFPAPTLVCNGMDVLYSYGTLAIGGGGFVSGLIASPTQKDVKYARTDVGGAYKWNAADCSWKPLNNFISEDDNGLLSIEGLAIDPSNPDRIYMVGGSMYLSGQKTAIMRSHDGGKTFNTVDVTGKLYVHGNGDGRGNGERIAVDPNNGDIIYCGGRVGNPLIVSTNAGGRWEIVSSFPNVFTATTPWPSWTSDMKPTTTNANGVSAIVFDGSQADKGKTQRIFVGISQTGSNNVYVSEDGGTTWNAVQGLPTKWMPLRMKMDPAGNLLIAYADKEGPNSSGTSGGIYRYNPNTKIATDISPAGNYQIGDVSCSRTSADSLVCTTICTWVNQNWNTGNGPVHGDIIFTSTDGGKTWRSLQDNFRFDANGCTWIPDHAIHWSCSIIMDPFDNNKVSVTSGNGIFTTNNVWCDADGGPIFYFDVNGLEETVPLDMISIPGGDPISVIGDYTGFVHSNIHEFAPIHKPESGTTSGIAYASKNPDIMARVASEGSYYTENGGRTWTAMTKKYGKIGISADGKVLVYVHIKENEKDLEATGTTYYSTDKGITWNLVTGISAEYVIGDPENENYIYAAGSNTIYVSSDKGKTYTSTSLSNGDFSRICVVPGHEGLIYAPRGGNGLSVSTDHGKTFSSVPYVTTCNAVGVGAGQTQGSYVIYIWGKANGCEKGLYRSEDNGQSWQRINDETTQFGGPGNGKFVVGDQNVYGRFYMSTVGLGIVYGELTSNATSSNWNCFVDNSECKPERTSIKEESTENPASFAYPNPFYSSFNLDIAGEYVVVNMTGQIIEKGKSSGSTSLGNSWSTGVYFVKINGKTIKMIKL